METRNQADQAVYGAEKMLKEMADKIGASDKQAVETAVTEVKQAIEKDDAAAIKGALERLTSAQHKMAETLYQQSAPGAGPSAGPGPGTEAGAGAPKGDVIDAEVVDEGKK